MKRASLASDSGVPFGILFAEMLKFERILNDVVRLEIGNSGIIGTGF